MSFMQKQIVHGKFVEVESSDGSTFQPIEYFDASEITMTLNDDQDQVTLTLHVGFFGRMSAPGYLDCTDWSGPFETEEECMSELVDMYGDEEEDEEDEEEEEAEFFCDSCGRPESSCSADPCAGVIADRKEQI